MSRRIFSSMTNRVAERVILSTIIICISVMVLSGVFVYEYSVRVVLFPLSIGLISLLLAVSIMFERVPVEEREDKGEQGSRSARAYYVLIALVPVVLAFGFVVGSGFYLAIYTYLHGRSVLLSLMAGLSLSSVIYAVFDILLSAGLYRGVFLQA